MSSIAHRMERHQVPLSLAAVMLGIGVGLLAPGVEHLQVGVNPAIALLLYVTFLGVPFVELGRSLRDVRFLVTLLVLNFLAVPVIAFLLSRFVAMDDALLVGVLFVLLTPCVDYVIVFTAAARGAHERLLAAAPLLMIAQLLLLPLYLLLFAGQRAMTSVEPGPFVKALVLLIVVPLLAAALTQWVARQKRRIAVFASRAVSAMVPLMVLVLFLVVASQTPTVADHAGVLMVVVPLYVAFLAIMPVVGLLAARLARLDIPQTRALIFSGATRNSLVVLPLALALPQELRLAAVVVVAQTVVELVGMAAYVHLVPRLTPER